MELWARVMENQDGEFMVFEVIDFDPEGKYHEALKWVKIPEHLHNVVGQGFFYDYALNSFYPPSSSFFLNRGRGILQTIEHLKTRIGVDGVSATPQNIEILRYYINAFSQTLYEPLPPPLESVGLHQTIYSQNEANNLITELQKVLYDIAGLKIGYTKKLLEVSKYEIYRTITQDQIDILEELQGMKKSLEQKLEELDDCKI